MVTRSRTTHPSVPRRGSTKSSSARLLLAIVLIAIPQLPLAQTPLQQLASTERAFAARAKVVGYKQAFLEYFAESAIGFDGETAGSAKEQLRQVPDPPKDLQLLWEPRFG